MNTFLTTGVMELEARRLLANLGFNNPQVVRFTPIYEGGHAGVYLSVENDGSIYGVTMPAPDERASLSAWSEKYLRPAVCVVHMNLVNVRASA